MELFKSGLKTVLGHSEPSPEMSGAETVERLVERLHSSTLLEDRRDACRGLKAMSKKYRVEVGAQGMNDLIDVLVNDSSDAETTGYALDSLCNITAKEPFDEEEDLTNPDIGDQFTEIFIKTPENVHRILAQLEEFEFKIRYPAVRLLTNLLINRPREIQDIVLVSPMGVSKMMDLLNDPREVIRNDALVMLTQLTKGNANIQKIVAFENAFDRLYAVISEEGAADGGIVVEDCLLLMLNLLRNNPSNQSFFREGSYIQRLTPFFSLTSDQPEMGWSAQKVSNVHYMLQVVRTLVSPSNPKQETLAAQRVMHTCGLLALFCQILMASGVPADILTETINTVSEVIRGSELNQTYFSEVMAPSSPPRPAIVVLLMSMVNEKQPFVLRCAVLYCFQCYLFRNPRGQADVVQTLLPSQTAEAASGVTAGQLLCGGVFSADPLSNWFSAVALSHCLVNSAEQRTQLLRVQLATSVGQPPVSLLQQAVSILQQTTKLQTRLGLLMLLGTWLANCTPVVNQFLRIPSNVPYLMSQLNSNESDELDQLCQGVCAFVMGLCAMSTDNSVTSYTKEELIRLIERRVGVETFLNKLGLVMKHELYSRSLKHPQISARDKQQLVFDHQFCKLFKALESNVIKVVTMEDEDGNSQSPSPETENDSEMVQRYKQLIRQQDEELAQLRTLKVTLEGDTRAKALQIDELTAAVQQLRDQNTLLRAQINTDPSRPAATADSLAAGQHQQMAAGAEYERQLRALAEENARLTAALQSHQQSQETDSKQQNTVTECDPPAGHPPPDLISRDSEQPGSTAVELQQLQRRLADSEAESEQLRAQLQQAEAAESVLRRKVAELQPVADQLQELQKEQEDLLVLLTDQETRLEQSRSRLRQLGVQVEDDDD